MKVAVIGTGNMGAALTRALAAANTDVVVGHRDPAKAATLAAEVGAQVEGGGITAALKVADIVILALPYQAILAVLKEAGDVSGKVLVDISNPITPDFKGLALGHTTSAAEEIQAVAPGAKVVKAFNTLFAGLFSAPPEARASVPVFLTGDDATAVQSVADLAQAVGFAVEICGPLDGARLIEPLGMLNIRLGIGMGRGVDIAPTWISVSR